MTNRFAVVALFFFARLHRIILLLAPDELMKLNSTKCLLASKRPITWELSRYSPSHLIPRAVPGNVPNK